MHELTDPAEVARRELLAMLHSVHVIAGRSSNGDSVWLADPRRPLDVTLSPAPTLAQTKALISSSSPGVVVADRLAAPQRAALSAAGWSWWDRRGALVVVTTEATIELAPAAVAAVEPLLPSPFSRVAGRTVGLELLRAPEARRTVRDVVDATGLSVGAVGRTMAELADDGLLHGQRPVVPALFEALAAAWRPRWHRVAGRVGPTGVSVLDDVLRFGLDVGAAPGWAMVSTHALLAYGGPSPLYPGPVRLFGIDERAVAWAVERWGVDGDAPVEGDGAADVVEIAVPPSPGAVLHRHPWGGAEPGGIAWRLADPLVVALTLAADPEPEVRASIAAWRPGAGTGVTRVW